MKQTLSRYEIDRNHAFQQLMNAINESDNYIINQNYVIVARNSTDDYTYGFTITSDGAWCDTCFERECDTAYECALKHKGDRYVVVLGKYDFGEFIVIKEYHVIK